MKPASYDVIIVGSGLAAITTALSLPKDCQVLLICKGEIADTSSRFAQGGIAAVMAPTDSVQEHVTDTLIAGAGLCDPNTTEQIIHQGADAIAWLSSLAVPFSTTKEGLHLTKEGGHNRRRICHVADHTGQSVMACLWANMQTRPNIHVLERCFVTDILTELDVKTKKVHCKGVVCLINQQSKKYDADKVVLATGGLGQIYQYTTAPEVCTGDGIAMAYRAGCRIVNAEFVQFHPTGFDDAMAQTALISEAVRGEGGRLINAQGERFMSNYDERLELAPRDVVARSIIKEAQRTAQGVFLDISHQSDEFIKQHFPKIYQSCLAKGVDITKQPIPVTPVQHYFCGGVLTDVSGRSDVVGLYCLGEMAYTGLHGANRLASNSLLECLVMGQNAAKSLQEPLAKWSNRDVLPNWSVQTHQKDINLASSIPLDVAQIKQLMQQHLGVMRRQEDVAKTVELLAGGLADLSTQNLTTQSQIQKLNLTMCAYLVAKASLDRPHSIGCHYWVENEPNLIAPNRLPKVV